MPTSMIALNFPWLEMKTFRKNGLFHPKNKNYKEIFSVVPLFFVDSPLLFSLFQAVESYPLF